MRLKGWLGRADQTTKVKGMFVHPSQIAEIVSRHPGLLKARLTVDNPEGNDRMTLQCETQHGESGEALAAEISRSIREVTKLRGEATLCAPGTLPNDGKVIVDTRRYV